MFEVEIHGDDDDEYHLNHYGKSSGVIPTFEMTQKSSTVTSAMGNKSDNPTEENGTFEDGGDSEEEEDDDDHDEEEEEDDDDEYELHPECHCIFIEDEEHEDEQDIEDKQHHPENKEGAETPHDNLHVSQFIEEGDLLSIDNDIAGFQCQPYS
ncbi:unnamed protein product [Ambrosiozyma monospora]|uniref:Unnamed protein product n=1 Tax=Ambrosiozyma monospora TaxID=43982 RepID=A0ACB5UA88_AMBMO|nr:unnamed protein product [Ambrosiozyma monospora]